MAHHKYPLRQIEYGKLQKNQLSAIRLRIPARQVLQLSSFCDQRFTMLPSVQRGAVINPL
jgi:hypothetical protein